jgi:hypothetical protein
VNALRHGHANSVRHGIRDSQACYAFPAQADEETNVAEAGFRKGEPASNCLNRRAAGSV